MADHGETVRVEIFDRTYNVRSDEDVSYTRRLAKELDTTMHSIAEQTESVDSLRVAVLAALHFVDRYERLKHSYDQLNGTISERSERILKALDDAAGKSVG